MESPPAKVANLGYRYCPHCEQTVSNRTYLKHASLPSMSLFKDSSDALHQDESVNSEQPQSPVDPVDAFHDLSTCGDDDDEDVGDFADSSEYNESSSGSEYEDVEEDIAVEKLLPKGAKSAEVSALVSWFVIFVRLWQTMYSISDKAIGLLLKFFSAFLGLIGGLTSSVFVHDIALGIPATVYMLKKYFEPDTELFIKYVTCPSCFSLYKYENCFCEDETGESVPIRCTFVKFPMHPQRNRRLPCNAPLLMKVNMSGGKVKYIPRYTYAYQPIEWSLQKLLNRPGFSELLEHWRSRESAAGLMSDIYDGQVWKDFNSPKFSNYLAIKRCYGLMLNFDFFQPYKHTTDSYGVFYLTLLNLPRNIRFKEENIMLVGIIPAFEHEPSSLNTFMEPLVSELKQFWNPGVKLFTAESPRFRLLFKLALMCVACDIPAARKVCGFMGHSANKGCSRCLKSFVGGFNEQMDYSGFNRETWPSRKLADHKATCAALKKCRSRNSRVSMESKSGIKYSVLVELPYFNPIRFTIVDPMHNLFLGTAKHIMKVWTERDIITKENLKTLQSRVDLIRVPSDVGRIPRKIASSFGGFTAEQWKNWVILFSMFALRGILPEEHYVCWQTFVLACFYLCRREISLIDLKRADLLLINFCKRVQDIYGPSVITPNMHLHCHIASCVKDYGSIYNFWLFAYERYNGILGDYPTNKRNSSVQLMQRFIYETEVHQIPVPALYGETFNHIFPLTKQLSDVHQHHNSDDQVPFLQHATLSPISKFTAMNSSDYENLKTVYSHLYGTEFSDNKMVQTIRVYKTITLFNQRFGSLKSPSTAQSAYIMSSWPDSDGSIQISGTLRPGKVLYYFSHQYMVNGSNKEHLFAAVYWFAHHFCRSLYGKPLEVWSTDHITEGPAMFLPIHKLECRCIAAHGTVPLPEANQEERVIFVSPLPNLKFS